MAYCVECRRNVGCSCNLLESKWCSQKCKDEFLNKQNITNDSIQPEVLQQLQQPETNVEGDRLEAV